MIDYVYGGEFMTVTSNKGSTPYISPSSQPMTGMLSYDNSSQSMKVYDGNSWQTVGGGTAMVNLSPDAIETLKWAKEKMRQEQELKALAAINPTIKDLVDSMTVSVREYEHKIEMVKALIQKEEVTVS
jgi:hypothetical protein